MRRVSAVVAAAILSASLIAPTPPYAADSDVVEEAGRTFPRTVSFQHGGADYELRVTGTSVRKKFFFKAYAIAHYMAGGPYASVDDALEAALSGEHAMQITMDFVRDIDAEKIQKAYREGFRKQASEEEYAEIEPLVERFVGYFNQAVQKQDQYVLRSLPGGVVLATIRGQEGGPIENPTFARVLWRIWLADGSVVDRKDLVRMAVHEEEERESASEDESAPAEAEAASEEDEEDEEAEGEGYEEDADEED